jgi:hypothetical protein
VIPYAQRIVWEREESLPSERRTTSEATDNPPDQGASAPDERRP